MVREAESENDIWWNEEKNGSPNFEMDDRWVLDLPGSGSNFLYVAASVLLFVFLVMTHDCCRTFLLNRERAVDYLNMLDRLYVFDGYAGWDPEVSFAGSYDKQACSAY